MFCISEILLFIWQLTVDQLHQDVNLDKYSSDTYLEFSITVYSK